MSLADAVSEMAGLADKAQSAKVKELLSGYLSQLRAEAEAEAAAAAPPAVEEPEKAAEPASATGGQIEAAAAHADPQALAAPAARPRGASRTDKGPMQLQLDKMGDGMIDNMKEHLDTGKVQFALVQVPIGSGTFQRDKMIFVEWAGPSCNAMRRAKHVQKKGDVKKLFGYTHAGLALSEQPECCIEHVLKELKGVFVSDSGQFSAAAAKAEIEAAIARAKRADLQHQRPGRKTAKDMGMKEDAVFVELRKQLGKFNWCLVEPAMGTGKLKMFNAGSMSIDEMHDNLDESKVLFGLIRLGFGKGEWRRTKWICISFVGQECGAVKRGKELGCKAEMEKLLSPYSISVEVRGKEDATVGSILDRVRNFIISDDLGKDDITPEKLMEGLREEQGINADFFGDEAEEESSQSEEVTRAIKLVQAKGAPHWACFSIM